MMDDSDYIWLSATVLMLAICSVLDARRLTRQDRELTALRTEVEYLKDHTVARETEARPQ